MSKFKDAPNLNDPKLSTAEGQADVNVAKKLEGEITPEELEKLRAEKGEEQELSQEDQLKNLEGKMETLQIEMRVLTEYITETKDKLNETRKQLNLPPNEEEPISIFSEKDKLEKLKIAREALEKQKEELVSQQEKERLINEEKEKILQEKFDELFKEFGSLNSQDLNSILKSGRMSAGHNVESKSMGSLNPEVAQFLSKAFKKGIKLSLKDFESMPDFLKEFNEDLMREAMKRVDEKIEEEKQKIEKKQEKEKPEELKPEEELKISKDSVSKVDSEINLAEGGNVETPEV